jgi:hypothetical protein
MCGNSRSSRVTPSRLHTNNLLSSLTQDQHNSGRSRRSWGALYHGSRAHACRINTRQGAVQATQHLRPTCSLYWGPCPTCRTLNPCRQHGSLPACRAVSTAAHGIRTRLQNSCMRQVLRVALAARRGQMPVSPRGVSAHRRVALLVPLQQHVSSHPVTAIAAAPAQVQRCCR